jgi:hypothetical protein
MGGAMTFRCLTIIPLLASLVLLRPSFSAACPLCGVAGLPLSEQLKNSEVALLVRWREAEPASDSSVGSTTYEIRNVLGRRAQDFHIGDNLRLPGYQSLQPGELHLLLGVKIPDEPNELDWSRPRGFTAAAFDYLRHAPATTEPTTRRLEYYARFLEHSDTLIANDAFGEFAAAPYEDVVPLAGKLSRNFLRLWIEQAAAPNRVGFYALMLALQGQEADAELLWQKIHAPTPAADFRQGLDGLMAGYLLLTGEQGLTRINKQFLQAEATTSDAYAAMQALRFLWQYEPDRLPQDALRASMRHLLDRDDLAELAVRDLARWQDWSSMEGVVKLFDRPNRQPFSLRVSVVQYLCAAIAAGEREQKAQLLTERPAFAITAQKHLEALRQREPKLVATAERQFAP